MRRSRRPILELCLLLGCRAEADIAAHGASAAPLAASRDHTAGPVRTALAAEPYRRDVKKALRKKLERITAGRYLEGSCRRGVYPGWEGFPVRRCRYSVAEEGGHKSTEVLLLDPSAKKLARWIERACEKVKTPGCPDALVERILWQSSAQFPVAGIVLEDIRPGDGRYEMYCFRHGVRVQVVGFPTLSTDRPDDTHLGACLEGALIAPTAFARIAGTTPAQYRAAGGTIDVGSDTAPTARWLDVSRELYQAAWRGDDNALIEAWALANLK